ncbi:fatty acyl-CoA reductase 2-like [Cocos nucifera]|uniref:Fatty acyl-CoA reductase n=1 Tax=Cocos nucifera TaxID=13894 RepID=A0A8K0I278_COCNU|nr:fatty acyl-CoA reductase 2-like [Cocos nucifera]
MGSSCLNSSRTVLERPISFSFDKQCRPCPTSGFSLLMRRKYTNIVRCQGNGNVRNPNGYPPIVTERPAAATVTEDHMVLSSNAKIRKDVGMMDLTSYKETTALGTIDTCLSEGIGIVRFLRGKEFLITGATGFLGKVLIEKILRTNPDVGKIYVLIKAKDKEAAMERLKCEIVNIELFRCLKEIHGSNYQAFMLRKLIPVVGNVREANLGLETGLADEISEEVDVIINSAANTTFDERYDVALDINTIGPCRIMSFAKRFKRLKLLLHVSTDAYSQVNSLSSSIFTSIAYVNGQRQENTPLLDIETEIKLAFDSKKTSCDSSMIQEMKDLGLERAKIHGWQDTYVFTKAMGEMAINCMRGDIPVVTIRPSVIESTCKEPFPGWMEGNRFDNANTQKLMEEMSEEERTSFDFNVASISWKDYISNVHIPGLRRHVMKGRGICTKSQLVGTTL